MVHASLDRPLYCRAARSSIAKPPPSVTRYWRFAVNGPDDVTIPPGPRTPSRSTFPAAPTPKVGPGRPRGRSDLCEGSVRKIMKELRSLLVGEHRHVRRLHAIIDMTVGGQRVLPSV